jgi:ribosome-associated translation inhibitor RaiA
MSLRAPVGAADVNVAVLGPVRSNDVAYARRKVAAGLKHAPRPVLYARVTLTQPVNKDTPAGVTANADVNGRIVHVEASCPTMHEAIDEIHDRLRDRIDHLMGE